jgi:hypothetical protein
MMIDPEDFLHHHHAALGRTGRIGAIGTERMLVGRIQGKLLTQSCLPYFLMSSEKSGRVFSMRPAHPSGLVTTVI